jgi:hypothetical protein
MVREAEEKSHVE